MKKLSILIILLVSTICFSACKKEPKETIYKYFVTGTSGDYSITYSNSSGGTEQKSSVPDGWSYSWTDKDFERFLYISAQNNKGSGTVEVSILQDGKIIKTAKSSGAYVIATASR